MNTVEKWAVIFKDENITMDTLSCLDQKQMKISHLALAALESGKFPKKVDGYKDELKIIKQKLKKADNDSCTKITGDKVSKISSLIFGTTSVQMLFDKIAAYRQDVHNAENFILYIHGEDKDCLGECDTYAKLNTILISKEKERRQEIEQFVQLAYKRHCILELYVILEHINTLNQASRIINLEEEIVLDTDLPSNITTPTLSEEITKILKKFKDEMSNTHYDALNKALNVKDITYEKAKDILDKLNAGVNMEFSNEAQSRVMAASKDKVLEIQKRIKSQEKQEKKLEMKYGLKK